MKLEVKIEKVGDKVQILRCKGELDAHTFEDLDGILQTALEDGPPNLAVELAEVPYMSSAGIGVLIGSKSEAENLGGTLVLVNPTAAVNEVFESMGFNALFTITATLEEALKAMGVSSGESENEAASDGEGSGGAHKVAKRKEFED